MRIGTLLEFPEGHGGIPRSARLHLLDNSRSPEWTFLVEFIDGKEKRADIHRMLREDFESGLLRHTICECDRQPTLPSWLESLEDIDLHSIEAERTHRKRKKSNIHRATVRLCVIEPLLARADQIFESDDPTSAIAALAREHAPSSHPDRVRLWLTCYLVFGRELGALYPSFVRVGHWDRRNRIACEPLGRLRRDGKGTYCHVTVEIGKRIEEGYVKHEDVGRSQKDIYSRILGSEFGCTTRGSGEDLRIVSRNGEPFPTFNQIAYSVRKAFDPDLLKEAIYGIARFRHRVAPDQGRYSFGVANVFEQAEADGYFRKDRLRDFDGKVSEEKLCVVRLVDDLSGVVAGIGFSWGSETASAYRMALFCAAVKKSVFGQLFGVDIKDDDWPCEGIPAKLGIDRGSGAAKSVQGHHDQEGDGSEPGDRTFIPWRELVPSFSPMDKATVESSHPRTVQLEGRPMVFESVLTPIEAAKGEIRRAIRDNWGSDASDRLTPDMIEEGVPANPMSIWKWFDERGRTSAEQISFDQAVRTFLSPVEFTATRDFLKLEARRFGSPELQASGFHRRVARNQTVTVTGYAMNFCVRHAWVTVAHRLIQVDGLLPIRDNDAQLFTSLDDLAREKEKLATLRSDQRERAEARELHYQESFKKDTGKEADAGRWSSARRGRSGTSSAHRKAVRDAMMPDAAKAK